MSLEFVKYNANYYGNDIQDCVIRAISLGTNIGYTTICKCFKKEFKPGFGMLSDGISKKEVDEFIKHTHFIEETDRDTRYVNWITGKTDELDINYGISLYDYAEALNLKGRYVISTRKNTFDRKEANKDLHMVLVDFDNMKLYDTWDSRNQLIYCVYKVKTIVGDKNKYSIKNDKIDLIEKFRKEQKHS